MYMYVTQLSSVSPSWLFKYYNFEAQLSRVSAFEGLRSSMATVVRLLYVYLQMLLLFPLFPLLSDPTVHPHIYNEMY